MNMNRNYWSSASLIRGSLFNKGFMTRQPGLSDVLEHHKQGICNRIRAVTDLDQMTDTFLSKLVQDSLVGAIHLHFDKMMHKPRSEQFDGSEFPDRFSFNVEPGHSYSKTVVRITIPFTGDRQLLEYTPNSATFNFPRGEVNGQSVQFDVIFWGYHDDNERVKQEIEQNRDMLESYAVNTNKQVKQFNEQLFEQVKPVFQTKLDELTRQLSVFDTLGIKEEPDPVYPAAIPVAPKPKKAARASQIIQYIEKQYVQQLNQTNNNDGDVNNAIQSS